MAKTTIDWNLFTEDIRIIVNNEHGSYSISLYPADIKTKEWILNRNKEINKKLLIQNDLQWYSLGLLEFMEINNIIWYEIPRHNQIIFNLSILRREHIEILQTKIEKKYSIRISSDQIQPIPIQGLKASLTIKVGNLTRKFFGYVRNLDSIRPLQCVFDFSSESDLQLVLEDLNLNNGVRLTCFVSVGGVKFEKLVLSIPKQRIIDAKILELGFGDKTDFALFTSTQVDILSQMIVNTLSSTEISSVDANITDLKSLVVSALQCTHLDVTLTSEIITKLSPINGEATLLTQLLEKVNSEEYLPNENDIIQTEYSPHRPPLANFISPIACEKTSSNNITSSPAKKSHKDLHEEKLRLINQSTSHKLEYNSHIIPHITTNFDDDDDNNNNNSNNNSIQSHHHNHNHDNNNNDHHNYNHTTTGIAMNSHSPGKSSLKMRLFKIFYHKVDTLILQLFRINPQNEVYSPIEIDTRVNVCKIKNEKYVDIPSNVTNICVVRLSSSAWVSFTPPYHTGGSPIQNYIVYAQPIVEYPDEDGMINGIKETKEHKYLRKSIITSSGTQSPICVESLRDDISYRYVIETINMNGESNKSEPVLETVNGNEQLCSVPLYGIIAYAGPIEEIPKNYRRLDGSVTGVPNLTNLLLPKLADGQSTINDPTFQNTIPSDGGPKWMNMIYIQRIA